MTACLLGQAVSLAQLPRPEELGARAAVSQGTTQNDALLKRVDEHYNHLGSLRAHFVESYHGMGVNRVESGTLLMKKPGQMRWSYDKPEGKLFVLDGKYAWFYTPGDPQVQRLAARQVDDLRTPLRFLLGHTQLKKELEKISITSQGPGFRIDGVPRGMGDRIKQLSLRVTDAGAISVIRVEETDGAVTEFTFSDLEENAPASGRDFHFTPPEGVPVVDGPAPL